MLDRRQFFAGSAAALAFGGLALRASAKPVPYRNEVAGYGPLLPDPERMLDLPRGFSYRVISRLGERMSDGWRVPDRADGMGAFALPGGKVALVRNHELQPRHFNDGPLAGRSGGTLPRAFDSDGEGRPLPGGTTTLVYDPRNGRLEREWLSLAGTIRNCAGGITPWGSWLTCEETLTKAGDGLKQDHGWVFEVPARGGLAAPIPLKGLGRFNHEAACIDPRTGITYLTEDESDGLFYRFLPERRGRLNAGGRLQALGFRDQPRGGDSRNWERSDMSPGAWKQAMWIDMAGTDNPGNDLKARGHKAGATLFARGEGIEFGQNELYFMCTSGGAKKLGQIFRYRPSRFEGRPGERDEPGLVQLFFESADAAVMNYGDNLTIAPNGHLIVCEDQYTDTVNNHLRGIDPAGRAYAFAHLHTQTELAGACFSPDGKTLFVNAYSPTKTLAITGPWSAIA